VIPLAADFPSPEFIIFAVAILLGIIGKVVEFSKQVRKKSLEETEQREQQFGADLEEASEPPPVEAPPERREPVRRPLPVRIPWRPMPGMSPEFPTRPVPPPAVPLRPPQRPRAAVAPPGPPSPHAMLRMLRARQGARTGIILSEILGPPKALRRWR